MSAKATAQLCINYLSDQSVTYDVTLIEVDDGHESIIEFCPTDYDDAMELLRVLMKNGVTYNEEIAERHY